MIVRSSSSSKSFVPPLKYKVLSNAPVINSIVPTPSILPVINLPIAITSFSAWIDAWQFDDVHEKSVLELEIKSVTSDIAVGSTSIVAPFTDASFNARTSLIPTELSVGESRIG